MSKELFGITFLAWQWWKLFPLIIVLFGCAVWSFVKRYRALSLFSPKRSLIVNYSTARSVGKIIVFSLGLFLLWVGMLRPSWGVKDQQIKQAGRDLLIVLDVSRSMLAQDLAPSRLEFAKKKINALVRKLDCDRVGLMLFSGAPIIQCPLTRDYAAFHMFLNEIDSTVISAGTTALDVALKKSLDMFEKLDQTRKNKIVVVFTDGEDFSSNLGTIRQEAIKQGMIIFTVGVGTIDGAPIPLYDLYGNAIGHQKDEHGSIVISRLNEGTLKVLANESGGHYTSISESNNDIQMILQKIFTFEREKLQESQLEKKVERYPLMAALSLGCFLIDWLV